MIDTLSLHVAFIAGLVSFLSPCVLPLIPGFLAYLSGTSVGEGSSRSRREIFFNSVFFVLGFSAVFAILGVLLNTLLQSVAYDVQIWLSRIGGAIIIFFGLYLLGIIKVSFLDREHKLSVKWRFHSRYATSFVFGAAFAAGWTPCVGAALGAILGLAATQPGAALYLLFAYSVGLGFPFLLVGLFAAQSQALIQRYVTTLKYVQVIFGALLILLGVLVFTQSLSLIASFEFVNRLLLN
ncbi:cytochrome C biogenesis protein [Candidatus Kaiserbacteria bacterium]|nr:cytochrome C biogenesis protein [Candidatus Kaiserbacteria bacterium]